MNNSASVLLADDNAINQKIATAFFECGESRFDTVEDGWKTFNVTKDIIMGWLPFESAYRNHSPIK